MSNKGEVIKGLGIEGSFELLPERRLDERGYFQRLFENEMLAERFEAIVQTNVAFNKKVGTWRGLHYQKEPSRECKFVSCLVGSARDILFDARTDSESYEQVLEITLDGSLGNILFVPSGVAHGYITLEPNTLMVYGHTAIYRPELDTGVNISSLPIYSQISSLMNVISDRDKSLPEWSFNNEL